MKTNFISAFMLFIVLTGVSLKISAQARYNVIFIVADDMNDKVPFLGYPEVLTPNLQRLLSRGMAFTSAYCQFPLCNPSRVSMMSGWRPNKTNVFGNGADPAKLVPSDVKYLQDYLHSFGYRTERYGKIYHGQFEYEFNWDFAEDDSSATNNLITSNNNISPSAENTNPPGSWGINTVLDSGEEYNLVTDLVKSLKQNRSQPGFYALGLSAHNPFTPNLANWNKYGDPSLQVNIPIWKSTKTITGNSSNNIQIPLTPENDREDIPPVAFFADNTVTKSDSEWRKTVQAYYAEVSTMDRNLGVLLDEMDQDNLWANTVVIFISDHGQHLGEHNGVWQKNTLFKESLHIPLIVYSPGKASGICNKLVETVDVYPTITELCKVPTPANLEGSSFSRLLDDPLQPWKNAVFSTVKLDDAFPLADSAVAVHTAKYHYNNWGEYGEELYNREKDPFEYTNQVSNSEYKAMLDQLRLIKQMGWENSKPPACDSAIYYPDYDGDGYGNNDSLFKGCYLPFGYVRKGGDCNDSDAGVFPKAPEICDGKDNNCDGQIDETCLPQISINSKGMPEGNSGTKKMWFTINLSQASTSTVKTFFTTSDSTAIAGSDYTGASKRVNFLPGETSKRISVSVTGDAVPEPNEIFKVLLSNPQNATILNGAGIGKIKNDDGSAQIAIQQHQDTLSTEIKPLLNKKAALWPNPAGNKLNIQLQNGFSINTKIELINLLGIKLKEWSNTQKVSQLIQLDLSSIQNGEYFLLISDDKGNRQTEKIIVFHY